MSDYILSNSNFTDVIDGQIHTCKSYLTSKADEYAADVDRLHNFRTAASLQGVSMREALSGMMAKHTISVFDLCRSEQSAPLAMWEEKITDHINYLLLLRAVVQEEHNNEVDNAIRVDNVIRDENDIPLVRFCTNDQ